MKGHRGDATLILVLVLAGAAALLWPSIHLPAFLQRKPPVKQVSQTEKDLEAARAALAQAQVALDVAKADAQAKKDDAARYAQQNIAGIGPALKTAPQTPEVILATELAHRAENGLQVAIGELPPAQRTEIETLVTEALSKKQAEVDAANKAFADKDAQLQLTSKALAVDEKAIPALKSDVAVQTAAVAKSEAANQVAVAQVVDYAQKKAASDAAAGSWQAYFWDAIRILAVVLILWFLVHFLFPSLSQQYPASTILHGIYSFLTSIFSSHVTTTAPTKPPTS